MEYFNAVFVIDYQFQILLHIDGTVITEPCEYHCYFKQTHYNYLCSIPVLPHGVSVVYRT